METNNPAQPENVAPQEGNHLEEVLSMEGYDKPVRNARILLFVVAAFMLTPIFMLDDYTSLPSIIAIVIYAFCSAVFVCLGLWTKRKPYNAIVGGIIVYSALIVIAAISNPLSIIQGWLVKVVIYSLLIVALNNAKEVQRWKDSLKK